MEDDGRGLPVDIHPTEKVPGVELVLTKLHSGGKFSGKNYKFSGGLHGVGVSVVNALSKHLSVWVKRQGHHYTMTFRNGDKKDDLEVVEKIAKMQKGQKFGLNRIQNTLINQNLILRILRGTLRPRQSYVMVFL